MEMSHVVPANHLELIGHSSFDFCLAHIALENDVYKKFFTERAAQGRCVYLDNGAWERDAPVEAKVMIELAAEMQPAYVYAPDYMNDAPRTLEAARAFGELARQNQILVQRSFASPRGAPGMNGITL